MKILYVLLFLLLPSFSPAITPSAAQESEIRRIMEGKNQAVNSLVTGTIDSLKGAKDFVAKEAPALAKEYIIYQTVILSIYVIVGLAMLITACIFVRKAYLAERNMDRRVGFSLSAVIIGLFGMGITASNISDLIYVIFAPRIYLIEHLAQLIKYGRMN